MSLPATLREALAVEYQNGAGEWVAIDTFDAGSILRSRRAAFSPGEAVTARRFRVVLRPGQNLGTAVFGIGRVVFFRELEALSPHRRWSFDFDTGDQRYGLVVTDVNAEVYRRGVRVASVPSPYSADEVTRVRRAQALDTLLGFHEDRPPTRFARQGAHDEWDCRDQPFENVPIFDFDGLRTGGVDEVQQLQFVSFGAGETFNLTLEGETTSAIAYSTAMGTLAASVQAALEALPNVGAGGCTVASPADKILRVTFIGNNRADDLAELVGRVLISSTGILYTSTVTQGRPGGEPVMSNTRGWPAAGVFFEQRLHLAAPRSRPQTMIGSRLGFPFDLNTRGSGSNKGYDVDLSTDQSTRILALHAGRQLQVFSQSAEFVCASQPITPPPAFAPSTRAGIEPGTPLFDLEGRTLFVQAGGDTIASYLYSDAEQNYVASSLSDYASHLVKGIVTGGFRRHRSTSEPNLALWIRADGAAVAMTAILRQDVLGFAPWTTDGAFTEAGGELAGDLYVCTRRTSDDADGDPVDSHRLEVLDDRHMLDASVRVEGVATQVSAPHLRGRVVACYIDGADAGDVTVNESGVAVLPYASQRSAEVGLLFVPRGRTLPIPLAQDPRGGASLHARSGEIAVRLGPTANLRMGMAGKKLWPVALKRRGGEGSQGALLDAGPGEDAFTGWTRVYPVPGFQQDSQVEWDQPRPGPLEIQELVVTVSS
jgi:hypothetical protein